MTVTPTFLGVRIISTPAAVRRVEDWSRVRSPARARRRMKRGFRQNVEIVEEPCCYLIGPDCYARPAVVDALRKANDTMADRVAKFAAERKP